MCRTYVHRGGVSKDNSGVLAALSLALVVVFTTSCVRQGLGQDQIQQRLSQIRTRVQETAHRPHLLDMVRALRSEGPVAGQPEFRQSEFRQPEFRQPQPPLGSRFDQGQPPVAGPSLRNEMRMQAQSRMSQSLDQNQMKMELKALRSPQTLNDFGLDPTAINSATTDKNVAGAISESLGGAYAESLGGGGVSPAITLIRAFGAFRDIRDAVRGRTGPNILGKYSSSAVMGFNVVKGPKNLPFESTVTNYTRQSSDGFRQFDIRSVNTVNRTFSTTEPGLRGIYGFDPNTDSIRTHTHTHSVTNEIIRGGMMPSPGSAMQSFPTPTPSGSGYSAPMPSMPSSSGSSMSGRW